MSFLALVEVVERLPSLWFGLCGSVAGLCATLETSSFFQLVLRSSDAPFTYLHVAFLLGGVTPMPATLGSP